MDKLKTEQKYKNVSININGNDHLTEYDEGKGDLKTKYNVKRDLLCVFRIWSDHQPARARILGGVGEVVQPEVDHVVAVVLARDHQVPRGLRVLTIHSGHWKPKIPRARGQVE